MEVKFGGTNVVSSSGVGAAAGFNIAASAHAFRILSSGLYSKKIEAVLREVACNAADAHIAVGTPERPIQVKLPTALDRQFYIKDWGPGLTAEEVTDIYTTYFRSTKGASNDFTGAFGLGSKSPFSYTTSFTLEVARDGERRIYSAYIGADGSPVISLMDTQPTSEDWQHGVMVSFPVEPRDFEEFRETADIVFRWFKVIPEVLGGTVTPVVFEIEGSNFKLRPKDGSIDSTVLMGNVAYPLSANRLGEDLSMFGRALINSRIVLSVPIGSVMPTAAREDLEYDEKTRNYLIAALDDVAKEVAQTVYDKAMVQPASCEWELHARIRQYATSLPEPIKGIIGKFLELVVTDAEELKHVKSLFEDGVRELPRWTGNGAAEIPATQLVRDAEGKVVLDDEGRPTYEPTPATVFQNWVRVYLYSESDRDNAVSRREVFRGYTRQGSGENKAVVPYNKQVMVAVADAPYAHERFKNYILDGDADYLISCTGAAKTDAATALRYAEALAKDMGGLPLLKASDLPAPERVVQRKRREALPANTPVQVAFAKDHVSYVDLTKTADLDNAKSVLFADIPESGQYYLVANRATRSWRRTYRVDADQSSQSFQRNALNRMLAAYKELGKAVDGLAITGVVLLQPGELKKYRMKENGWKNLLVAIREEFTAEVVEALEEKVDVMPRVSLTETYYLRSCGLVGLLAYIRHHKPDFWDELEVQLSDKGALLNTVIRFHTANRMPSNPGQDIKNAYANLRSEMGAFAPRAMTTSVLSDRDLANTSATAFPLVRFLDLNQLFEGVRADQLTLVRAVLAGVLRSAEEVEAMENSDNADTRLAA